MKGIYFTFGFLYFYFFLQDQTWSQVNDQYDDDDQTAVLLPNQSYCFEFTWMGPEYDQNEGYNGTCQDYLDSTRAKDVPCNPPIVITYNGTPPNIDYLWENYRINVLCRRSKTQVCARYTYSFNGVVNNATYMCTKVLAVGEGPVLDGCYTQKKAGYEMEICVCKSEVGIAKPCNEFK